MSSSSKAIVYYMCHKSLAPSEYMKISFLGKPTMDDFEKHYVQVYEETFDAELNDEYAIMEGIFSKLNSEDNPLSSEESQKFIVESGTHTSMSKGDIIKINDRLYCVRSIGFSKIVLTSD